MTGTIKKIVEGKDFGFITPDGQAGSKDVFFHKEALVDTTWDQLSEGAKVSFEVEQAEKGPKATNVRLA